jgi:uncharacterized membrane protein YoaK (UPF0700 family)
VPVPARPATPPALPRALIGLTFVTGMVDAASYLGLGRVFTANQTGNVVVLGFAISGAPGFSVPATTIALGCFLAGAVAGGRLGRALELRHGRWIAAALAIEIVALAVAAVVTIGLGHSDHETQRYAAIAVAAAGMGLRNATTRRLGVADLSTTVLTQTLTGLAADSRLAGGDDTRALRRVAAAVAMLCGAIAGGLLVRTSVSLTFALAAAGLLPVGGAYLVHARRWRAAQEAVATS